MKLRLGTRGSDLALAQARLVQERLRPHCESELVILKTQGDRVTDRPFAEIGPAGVFVRELETALLEERVDVAVHSYKDLPSESPEQLVIAAVPDRDDPADLLLIRRGEHSPEQAIPLRHGATLGTSSARRRVLFERSRPDLKIHGIRGNVPTRVEKLEGGECDGLVLAAAGWNRLLRTLGASFDARSRGVQVIPLALDEFIPAPSQGAIACQARRDDELVLAALRELDDPGVSRGVVAERALLGRVQSGCDVPFGAHCTHEGSLLRLRAFWQKDGEFLTGEATHEDPQEVARLVWEQLVQGATP